MRLAELIGQERATGMLRKALDSGRLHHTLLFSGPEGVGKWTAANALAAALLCSAPDREPDDGCGSCPECSRVQRLVHPDLLYVMPIAGAVGAEPSKRFETEENLLAERLEKRRQDPFGHHQEEGNAAISIAWVREIQRRLALRSVTGGPRVLVLRNAETMNHTAANAFLKTLEEPPAGCVIIMTTTAPAALLPTLLSRAQRRPFRELSRDQMERFTRLLRDRVAEPGDCRAAQSLAQALDEQDIEAAIAQSGGRPGALVERLRLGPSVYHRLAFEMLGRGIGRDAPRWLAKLESAAEGSKRLEGVECAAFLDELQAACRDVIAMQSGFEIVHQDRRNEVEAAAGRLDRESVLGMLQVALERRRLLQGAGTKNVNPALLMAVTFADLAGMDRPPR